MEKNYCSKCNKLLEAAVMKHIDPESFQGVLIRCDKEDTYCVYYQSHVYRTKIRNLNKERVVREYHKKNK